MYCTVSYLPHTDFEHGFPRSSSLQHKVFHLKLLEMPHTEHKHHFQNVKENAATTYNNNNNNNNNNKNSWYWVFYETLPTYRLRTYTLYMDNAFTKWRQ